MGVEVPHTYQMIKKLKMDHGLIPLHAATATEYGKKKKTNKQKTTTTKKNKGGVPITELLNICTYTR